MDMRSIHGATVFEDGKRNLRATGCVSVRVVQERVCSGVEMEPFSGRCKSVSPIGAKYTRCIAACRGQSGKCRYRDLDDIALGGAEVENVVGARLIGNGTAICRRRITEMVGAWT